jgi:predicted transcriptional regulator YheO
MVRGIGMSSDFDFSSYIQLVDFLGACFGENTEVVLYSFDDIEHSVIAIHNGHISGREVGAPLTRFALSKLKDKGKEGPPYYLNYLAMSKNNVPLRCNSFFILDKKGNPKGMLSINTDVTKYKEAAELLQKLAFIPSADKSEKENSSSVEIFQSDPEDVISNLISEITHRAGVPADRLTVDEKIAVVRRLNDEKFFLIKGAVSRVATILGVSEATVYRYLSNINKKMKNGDQL